MKNLLPEEERLRRWRLVLGGNNSDGTGFGLSKDDLAIDSTLAALYGNGKGQDNQEGKAGLGNSSPNVTRWLGDIRKYFPSNTVKIMQEDAIERLNLKQLLLEPEVLETFEPDINLVAQLIELGSVIPEKTKETAKVVIKKVLENLEKKLATPTRNAVMGSLNKSVRNNRPKNNEINWNLTIKKNLKHYQKEYKTIIPETLVGYGRKRSSLKDIIICIDQSGSMATSIVYSSIFGAVLSSIKAVSTKMIVFDTSVVDLTDKLSDPVDILFGVQLGGGTDINQALKYCKSLINRPEETILILISDLYEGASYEKVLSTAKSIKDSGANFITILALNDEGAGIFDKKCASDFTKHGIPSFACTPELFPDLMATAINKGDIVQWASKNNISVL